MTSYIVQPTIDGFPFTFNGCIAMIPAIYLLNLTHSYYYGFVVIWMMIGCLSRLCGRRAAFDSLYKSVVAQALGLYSFRSGFRDLTSLAGIAELILGTALLGDGFIAACSCYRLQRATQA